MLNLDFSRLLHYLRWTLQVELESSIWLLFELYQRVYHRCAESLHGPYILAVASREIGSRRSRIGPDYCMLAVAIYQLAWARAPGDEPLGRREVELTEV